MGFPVATRAMAADGITGVSHWGIGQGDSGTTGAGEASGGGYARKAATLLAADGSGRRFISAEVTFDLGAGTYDEAHMYDAASAGTFIGGDGHTAVVLGAAGQIKYGTGTYLEIPA